jgi:hypothetical protein
VNLNYDCDDCVGWMETWTGGTIHPLNPSPEDICLEDVAHHLAIIPRYNGATRRPYSVAEHSVILADWATADGQAPAVCLNYLLHDAAEAYLQDIIKPVKISFPLIKDIEDRLLRMIHSVLKVPYFYGAARELIKLADARVVLDERAELMPNHRPEVRWHVERLEPLGVEVRGLEWDSARIEFLRRYEELTAAMAGGSCDHHWRDREVHGGRVVCRSCGKDLGEVRKA